MVSNETMMFRVEKDNESEAREILSMVFEALNEKGYNSINQLVGYILSGDPTYITNHKNARSIIRKLERDELLEEIVKFYIRYNDYLQPGEQVSSSCPDSFDDRDLPGNPINGQSRPNNHKGPSRYLDQD